MQEAINANNGEPGAQATEGRFGCGRWPVFRASRVPLPQPGPRDLSVSDATTDKAPVAVGGAHPRVAGYASALRLPPNRGAFAPQRLTRATHRGHVWTWGFIADATVHGGALRMLTVLDEHTKEVHVLRPEQRIGAADVIALVQAAIAEHGAPEFISSDNGPEFIAKELQQWLTKQKIKTIYITPESPRENGFVGSLRSRFRDE